MVREKEKLLLVLGVDEMKLSEKEELLIKEGKIHAVLRWDKQEVKIGDIIFNVDSVPYKLVDRKRWKVFRCGAERSHIDWGCETVYDFKVLIGNIYKPYPKMKDDTIYLLIFKPDKEQRTLGL